MKKEARTKIQYFTCEKNPSCTSDYIYVSDNINVLSAKFNKVMNKVETDNDKKTALNLLKVNEVGSQITKILKKVPEVINLS